MTRVIAGEFRGRKLITPDGIKTRPTTDRCKEALFGMLQFDLEGVSFLDLFAGSGQIGIEALSRGASFSVFVEQASDALACIRQNLISLQLTGQAEVIPMSVERALARLSYSEKKFDYIFLDPPYKKGLEEVTLGQIVKANVLKEGGTVIVESSSQTDVRSDELECFKIKTYKTTRFTFFRQNSNLPV